MCGISGIVSNDTLTDREITCLEQSIKRLHLRGPDAQKTFVDNQVGFGHSRLAIIDTTHAADQPFHSSDGNFTIAFNGEIYNYKELRAELEKEGFQFKTSSDTEVLLYSYIHYGKECLNKLNGFFAFAVYNKSENSVFLARDRFGIKPLYIHQTANGFIFGSELKAIMAFDIKKEIDQTSLYQYLQLNYIPGSKSILKNTFKLEAGTFCEIVSGKINIDRYYSIETNVNHDIEYAEAQMKLRELMDKAVDRRLVSDVPLGTFLSGGVDSSIISTLSKKHKKDLQTFSIGYADEPIFDETEFAQAVADKIGSDHTVFKLKNNDLFEILDDVLDYIDEPFADSSALAVYILSKQTRKHVTVSLSGDGADELFSGYNKHKGEFLVRKNSAKNTAVSALTPLWKALPKSRNSKFGNLFRQLEKFGEGKKLGHKERYWLWASIRNEVESSKLIESNFDQNEYLNRKASLLSPIQNDGDFNDFLIADMKMVLEGDMLTKVDRMSMANSLEVRVPFLDHELVDFVNTIPLEYKICDQYRKKILQDTYRSDLPEILFKRPKHGFEVPLLKWFRTDLKDLICNNLLTPDFVKEQGIFNVKEINGLIDQLFSSNPGDSVAKIWGLIVFQHWYKKWMH